MNETAKLFYDIDEPLAAGIFEIPEAEAANVSDMVLYITVDGVTNSMQLHGGSAVWTENAEEVESEEETTGEVETSDDVSEDDISESDEYADEGVEEESDLAQEYMEALEELESGTNNEENGSSSGGNVTVAGSDRN